MSNAVLGALQRKGLRGFVGLGVIVSLQAFNLSAAADEGEKILTILKGERVGTLKTTTPSEVSMENFQTTVQYKSEDEPKSHEWFYEAKESVERRVWALPGLKQLKESANIDADLWDLKASYNLTSQLNKVLEKGFEHEPLGLNHSIRVHFAEDQKDVFKGRASGEGSFVGVVYTYGF